MTVACGAIADAVERTGLNTMIFSFKLISTGFAHFVWARVYHLMTIPF